jgi:hypothetical protein
MQRYGFDRVVIEDVRFQNEVAFVRGCGGRFWRVEGRRGEPAGHVSEDFWPSVAPDAVIDNSGAAEDLPARIAAALEAAYEDPR